MKTLKRFWGVALVVIMLATMVFGTAAPVSAANYAFSNDLTQPSVAGGGLAPAAANGYGISARVTTLWVDGGDGLAETINFTYTDQDGNAGQAGQIVVPAAAALNTAIAITLAAGDTGVQTLTAYVAAGSVSDATAGVVTFYGSDAAAIIGTFTAGPPPVLGAVAANVQRTYTNTLDVAQSGSTIYITMSNGATTNALYKSVNGGATWIPCAAAFLPNVAQRDVWGKVAVAPDDPNFVVVVDVRPFAVDLVYVSTDGGNLFSALTAPTTTAVINSVSVSVPGPFRYVAIGGNTAAGAGAANVASIEYWTIGLLAGAWTGISPTGAAVVPFNGVGLDDVLAVQFSPNFAADAALLAVTVDYTAATTVMWAEAYQFALGWNRAGTNFPRQVVANSVAGSADIVPVKATMALDTNFYLGDESTQIGFISLAGTDSTGFQNGGVWRFDYASIAGVNPLSKILGGTTAAAPGTAINSVAWDGTNLMAAVRGAAAGALVINRSANALSVVPSFVPNSPLKTPGTGTLPLVIFNGGVGYAFSSGPNSAVAKTTDNGKSFNGVALVSSNFFNIKDFWVSPDGAKTYVLADDGTDLDLWSKTGTTWERIMIIAAGTGTTWLVRADIDTPATVYVGAAQAAVTTVYKSLDAGQTTWTTRAFSVVVRDFVVQDANTIYAAVNAAATVIKSTNGAFTWSAPAATGLALFGNTIYSMAQIGDDKIVVGGNAGFVAYTADGATWAAIPAAVPTAAPAAILVAASGVATGDTIFAGSVGGTAGSIASWVIGTNTPLTGWNAAPFVAPFLVGIPASVDGLVYTNNTLFAVTTAGNLYRFANPEGSFGLVGGATDIIPVATAGTPAVVGASIINGLKAIGTTTLMARSVTATIDTMSSYTLYINAAADAPVPTAPINNAIIPVNSLNGAVQTFTFMWNAPPSFGSAPGQNYSYDVQVYLDELGTIFVAGTAAPIASPFAAISAGSAAVGGFNALAQPGTTYYWRVRVASGSPVRSAWSPMQTFSIQQLAAIVPVLASPANGTTINAGMAPAFSWNPIASATSYKFEVSTDPAFATTIYSTTTASAGAAIPSTVKLVAGTNYFWRVKTLTPAEGDWSAVSNFSIAAPVTTTVAPTQAPPTLTVILPPVTTTSIIIPPATTTTTEVNPSYIWAIIIIGAVLVIAVIVLIVRTRRSV